MKSGPDIGATLLPTPSPADEAVACLLDAISALEDACAAWQELISVQVDLDEAAAGS